MSKRYTKLVLAMIWAIGVHAQEEVTNRLIVIGNAGEVVGNGPFLQLVRNTVVFDSNTIVVYLGNYTKQPGDTATMAAEAGIIANTEAKAFFVPGFNEWMNGREGGYRNLLEQQRFLAGLNNKNVRMLPADGCSGPEQIELENDAELVVVNSQWWLHERSKPGVESECKYRTREEVLGEVEDIVLDEWDKMVLVLSYHPMKNTGVHGSTFGWKQHIFPLTDIRGMNSFYLPLPLAGSLYPITRNAITTNQQRNNSSYRRLEETGISHVPGLRKAFKDNPNTLFITGQEHNMQLLREGELDFIVSGAAGGGRIRQTKATSFASTHGGFSVIEVLKEKKVRVKFYEIEDEKVTLKHTSEVADFAKPRLAKDTTTRGMIYEDSTVAIADKEMSRSTLLRRIFIGENYRKEWGAAVKMKVFHLDKEKGGLKIKGPGGGHESKSLQMEDATGEEWGLRSINKNLEPVIPEGLHHTLGADIIQDILSGMNPYGALVVPEINKALNIPHATPEIRFVPNDTALKEYRPLFANTVMQIEERKPAINDNELVSTYEAVNEMITAGDHFADQKTFLKGRLVDVLIADFDRHRGQWSWGTKDSAGRKMYYPIPKDRDQALYCNRGLIMAGARFAGYSFMVNFKPRVGSMRRATKVGAHVDRYFTNTLTEEDWKQVLSEFREKLTDSVLSSAVHRFPREIYAIRGEYVYQTLRARRDGVAEKGMGYYRHLSRKVNVPGGNKGDLFKVSNQGKHTLVEVYSKEHNELKYSRLFDPSITKEIRLFGFNGDDRFDIDESTRGKIKFRVAGGTGADTFDIRGRVRNHIYDMRSEANEVSSRRWTTKMFQRSPSVHEYNFSEKIHSSFSLPVLLLGANRDDGFLAGLRLRYTTFGFRKVPYGSAQTLSGIMSPSNNAYQLKYTGEFINVFRRFDLTMEVETANPTFNNFFGYGNESVFDKSKTINYYRVRYNYSSGELLLRKRFLNDSIMGVSIGPAVYYYSYPREFNKGRILEDDGSVTGIPRSGITQPKFYGGGKMLFSADNVNNEFVPTQGVNWMTELSVMKDLNTNAESFSRIYSTLDVYAMLSQERKVMAALHFGGGHIFSKTFEYFQAFTLGGNNYLRGYRANRFTGSSVAYGSAELKVKLFDFNAYILKADVGLVGFTDAGRVWMKNENSQRWHYGYGGGIYLIPFDSMIFSVVLAKSEEDQLYNISLGTRINTVFQGNR